MRTYLDDTLYKDKILSLPKATSSQIARLEKVVKEEIELKKENEEKKVMRSESINIPKNKMTRLNLSKFI